MAEGKRRAQSLADRLASWLTQMAYPAWWQFGADRDHGGFAETVNLDGSRLNIPRRCRVQPRQIYAFAKAPALGWQGPAKAAVNHGLAFQEAYYRRPDGLLRTLVAAGGETLDERVLLYDQAFALLGYLSAYELTQEATLLDSADTLKSRLIDGWRTPSGGFYSSLDRSDPLLSNPHMHLFEACLAGADLGLDAGWLSLADDIGTLALARFIDPDTGGLREAFQPDWSPRPGHEGALLEPGHQFEWGWLLLRWAKHSGEARAREAALRLIDLGETYGIDSERQAAVASVLPGGEVLDATARLWPQTERLKAAVITAELTGDDHWWSVAAEAGNTLLRYFEVPTPGLWRDRLLAHGHFVEEPAPASSFYHIVAAIGELQRGLNATN